MRTVTPPDLHPGISHLLSPREARILRLLAEGYTNAQIGAELGMRERTVQNQLSGIYAVLGVTGRVQAARWALRAGLASLEPSRAEMPAHLGREAGQRVA